MQTDERVGTEAHTNKQMGGDRSIYKQTKGWGKKHIQTNKGVGTEAHTNKMMDIFIISNLPVKIGMMRNCLGIMGLPPHTDGYLDYL